MAAIHIHLLGDGSCRVEQEASGATLITDTTPEYGGKGRSFSSTDLVGVALGTCIATSIEKVAQRMGIEPEAIRIGVDKVLATNPKRIARLTVTIFTPRILAEPESRKLRKAAEACTVARSLSDVVEVRLTIQADESRQTGRGSFMKVDAEGW